MNCPVCKVPLIAVERERIEVDYCISCRGLWFDRGEMELLGEKLNLPLDLARLFGPAARSTEKPRNCPRCGKKMLKNELASNRRVLTDHCPTEEGLWFDAGELGTLLNELGAAQGAGRPVARFLGEIFGKSIGVQGGES